MLELNKIHNIDCLDGLKLLDDNSIDSIVTDPPYELGFMGKKWDNTGISYNIELWKECLRVLKPGGYLLSFGGSRTYHRMACAIEDAGFEIRDQIMWIYGSGFPKSMNVGKAVTAFEKYGNGHSSSIRKARMGDDYQPTGQEDWKKGMQFQTPPNFSDMNTDTELTDNAKQLDGWGTALKPAHEPIVVARKPLSEKTVAQNVLKCGTGGINIDGCRVGYKNEADINMVKAKCNFTENSKSIGFGTDSTLYGTGTTPLDQARDCVKEQGRFPANIIFDEEAGQLLDEQSGNRPSGKGNGNAEVGIATNGQGVPPLRRGKLVSRDDSGGASRFFYCAKTSKKERGEGNNHPTVKPLSLIKYLITLVTPPNGICLDPFEGSGTTFIACRELGLDHIGFELEKDYYEIALKRINI